MDLEEKREKPELREIGEGPGPAPFNLKVVGGGVNSRWPFPQSINRRARQIADF